MPDPLISDSLALPLGLSIASLPPVALRADSPAATRRIYDLHIHSAVATVPDMSIAAGELPRVPGYEVLGVLGEGGMGVVYRARQQVLKREVALKMIAAERVTPSARHRFQTEAETVARLRHPNFVQIYEVGEHAGRPFLALELVEGGSLADRLAATGPLPARDAAQLVAALAHAMHHAHERGIVHRDLKPGNVLLAAGEGQGAPKVTDFGLAKLLDTETGRTRSGAVLGTPAYMPPEQARGAGGTASPAVDVYALGAVLYECLTGQPPFVGETSWEVLVKLATADPQPPSRLRPRLSRDLDTICLKCLAKEPRQRYASAAELAEDLDRFTAGEAITARPEAAAARLWRKVRRRPLGLAVAVLLLGAMLLTEGYWQLQRGRAESALEEGRDQARRGAYTVAGECFERGLARIGRLPGSGDLRARLTRELAAAELRALAEQMMFPPEHLDGDERRRLAEQCERVWSGRDRILALSAGAEPGWEARVRADLRDVALRGLEVRTDSARREDGEAALARLEELREFGAPGGALDLERGLYLKALGRGGPPAQVPAPISATEFHLYGRAYAQFDRFDDADQCFQAGLRLAPNDRALHLDRAALALRRGRYDTALASFAACLAIQADSAVFSRRGFALLARAETVAGEAARRDLLDAVADFDESLRRPPQPAEALFGRGHAHLRLGDPAAAARDFESALERGYPRVRGLFALASARLAAGDPAGARAPLAEVLAAQPDHPEALALLNRMENDLRNASPK